MKSILNMLVFVLVLGSIIFFHELGHFLAAKFFGVYCGEFSLGMGPSVFHIQKGETEYHLRALPIGGFVAMAGEVDQEENENMKDVPFERTLKGIATWKQVIIMAAGVVMNFVLAFILMVSINVTTTQMALNTNEVGLVLENSVASEIGLQPGDFITDIYYEATDKSYEVTDWESLGVALSSDTTGVTETTTDVVITYSHEGKDISKEAVLTYQKDTNNYMIGIQMATRDLTFGESVQYALMDIKDMSLMIFDTLKKLVTETKDTVSQLSGPVGIYQVTSEVRQSGSIANMLLLVSMLSVNIGVFNLLPIPGLDGSQILFALVEGAMGREIPTKLRYVLQLMGLALVFGLMIIVMIQDVIKLF